MQVKRGNKTMEVSEKAFRLLYQDRGYSPVGSAKSAAEPKAKRTRKAKSAAEPKAPEPPTPELEE